MKVIFSFRVSLTLLFIESFHETRGIWLIKISNGQERQRYMVVRQWGRNTASVFHGVGLTGVSGSAVANFLGIEPHCALNRPSRLQKTCPLCNCIGHLHVVGISLHSDPSPATATQHGDDCSPFSHFISPPQFSQLKIISCLFSFFIGD